VRALTGVDPDRLPEEKTRGMTIDLGFASLRLPGGTPVSIVDVPGHERFVKNMLAGVGGIDLALLVVAADEGVMPQTREHLAILDLLGVDRGIIVITKADLVDDEWLEIVTGDVLELVAGTSLESAAVAACSAVTGDGLPGLLTLLETTLASVPPRPERGRPRLPIDRVFTVAGFGTVVTGTLLGGVLRHGDEVEIVPAFAGGQLATLRARVRTLQNHSRDTDTARPGTRTAANLAGIDAEQLSRGQIVTAPGWLTPSLAVDTRVTALADLPRPLRHNLEVTFHCLAAETPARLRLLDADELRPGESAWAQLRLTEPVAAVKGDRFVIRDANGTVGGGVVVATQARRHQRHRREVVERLEQQMRGSPADALLAAIAVSEPAQVSRAAIQAGLADGEATAALRELVTEWRVVVLGSGPDQAAYSASGFDATTAHARGEVDAFLQRNPLRFGINREELRSRLGLSPRLFAQLAEVWTAENALAERGALLAPPDWQPSLAPGQRSVADAFLAQLRSNPFAPVVATRPAPDVLAYLVERGDVVDVGGDVAFTAEAYAEMVGRVTALLERQQTATMAEVRDELGSSRRFVQALLEHLDRERVTLRRGDVRTLRGR